MRLMEHDGILEIWDLLYDEEVEFIYNLKFEHIYLEGNLVVCM